MAMGSRGIWTFIEEMGVLEAITLIVAVWLYSAGYYLLSTILMFGFGIAVAYMFDEIFARGGKAPAQISGASKPKFIEEFYIVEILATLSTFYFYSTGHYLLSAFFAFCLGIVFTYFYERMRGGAEANAAGRTATERPKRRRRK